MIAYRQRVGSKPYITWNHIDGPMLCCRNGGVAWLTLLDRFNLWTGLFNIYELERKYWG